MKKTLDQKLHAKKIKRPNKFIYGILKNVVAKNFISKKYNPKLNFKTDFRKLKGPYILISNHASRNDYAYNAVYLKERFNFVMGYNEFFRSHLAPLIKTVNCIPKRNFTPDFYTMKEIKRVLDNKGSICIYPEGMSSISGANQPVVVGTGKFLKHFGVPVYYTVIKGGYLSAPKYNLNDRFGTVEVDFDLMFTKEDLKNKTPQELEDIMNEKLYHDDYKWNLEKGYHFKCKDIASGLHDLLFYCPRCQKEFTMRGEGNKIECLSCGNGATLDDTYKMTPFDSTCVIPKTQTEWFNLEREMIKKQVQDPSFELKEHVKLGNLPDYKMLTNMETSIIVGEGILTLNHQGLTYEGTRNNMPFYFHLNIQDVPTYGMCTDVTRFYTFFNGEFMEFYPEHNVVEKWFLATEELHRANGGKWQDFKFDKSEINN